MSAPKAKRYVRHQMFKLRLAVCLLMTCVSGCSVNGHVIDTSCAWAKPIILSKRDILTDNTARQILAHNETWERLCRSSALEASAHHKSI